MNLYEYPQSIYKLVNILPIDEMFTAVDINIVKSVAQAASVKSLIHICLSQATVFPSMYSSNQARP